MGWSGGRRIEGLRADGSEVHGLPWGKAPLI